MKVRLSFILTAVVTIACLTVISHEAFAQTSCMDQLVALKAATQNTTFLRDASKLRADLLKRLDEAISRLSQGKIVDTEEKVVQFRLKVVELDAERKIAHTSATSLEAGADAVISCL